MKEDRTIRCAYTECALPDNNKLYWLQFLYLVLSAILLQRNGSSFSFFSIFMFAAPITVDLLTSGIKNSFWRTIKVIMIVQNSLLLLFCILGFSGWLVDSGGAFTINTSLVIPQFSIGKPVIFYVSLCELIVPLILFWGTPTKKTGKALTYVLFNTGEKK